MHLQRANKAPFSQPAKRFPKEGKNSGNKWHNITQGHALHELKNLDTTKETGFSPDQYQAPAPSKPGSMVTFLL